jgi:hypothetical protein
MGTRRRPKGGAFHHALVREPDDAPALAGNRLLLRYQVDHRYAKLLPQLEGVCQRGMLAYLHVVMHDHDQVWQWH